LATWEEVKRAIWWADRYLKNLYTEIKWNNKTYGIMRTTPSRRGSDLPLTLKLNAATFACRGFAGPAFKTFQMEQPECFWRALYRNFPINPTTKILGTPTETGEVWEGKIQYGEYYLTPDFVFDWLPFCTFSLSFQVDPNDNSQMVVSLTLESWDYPRPIPELTGDLYFNGELLITDCKNSAKNKSSFTKRTGPYKCFPTVEYWSEESLISAYYFWGYALDRAKALNMVNFLDDYGYTMWRSSPQYLGVRDQLPDNFLCLRDVYKSCDYWAGTGSPLPNTLTLPINEVLFPHWSRTCNCRDYTLKCRCEAVPTTCKVCFGIPGVLEICDEVIEGYPGDYKAQISVRACHLMNKYGSPDKKDEYGNSARDYLLNGFKDASGTFWNPIKTYVTDITSGNVKKFPFMGPHLIAFTELGYGFEDAEAKKIADDLVDLILPSQWGYPFTKGEEMWGRTTGAGSIRRPDHTGGFMYYVEIKNGNYYSGSWGGPQIPPWTNLECTLPTVLGLRIYEFYRWRLR